MFCFGPGRRLPGLVVFSRMKWAREKTQHDPKYILNVLFNHAVQRFEQRRRKNKTTACWTQHCDQLNNSQDLTGRYKHFTLPSIKIDPENHTFSVENNLPTSSNSLFGLFSKVCVNLGEGKSGRTWLIGATVQKDECQWPIYFSKNTRRPLSQTNILPYCKHLTINIITNYFELLTIYIYIILYYDFSPTASHKPMTPEKAQQALHRSSQWQGSRYHCGCHQPGGEHPFGFPRLLRAKGLHELSRGGSHDACAYWEWDIPWLVWKTIGKP